MRTIHLLLLLIVLAPSVAAFDSSHYMYSKDILDTPPSMRTSMIIIDEDITHAARSDLADAVVLEDGSPGSYLLILSPRTLIQAQARVSATSTLDSSQGISYSSRHLIDGDTSTRAGAYWRNDPQKDGNTSVLTFDFGAPVYTDTIEFSYPLSQFEPYSVTLLIGDDLATLSTIPFATEDPRAHPYPQSTEPYYPRSISYSPRRGRYIQLVLHNPVGLAISEVKINTAPRTMIAFFNTPGKQFQLIYGYADAIALNQSDPRLILDARTPISRLGAQRVNPLYNPDRDSDGVGEEDNCKQAPNPSQQNSDGDTFGDACDNCPSVSNREQADSDHDEVGDACDNCAQISNPHQEDGDLNSIGDLCDDQDHDGVLQPQDNCPQIKNPIVFRDGRNKQPDIDLDGIGDPCDPTDNRYSEHKTYLYLGFSAGFLILCILAYRLMHKTSDQSTSSPKKLQRK